MPARALRQRDQADDDEGADDGGGERAAQRKPAVGHRLVEEIAERGAERAPSKCDIGRCDIRSGEQHEHR